MKQFSMPVEAKLSAIWWRLTRTDLGWYHFAGNEKALSKGVPMFYAVLISRGQSKSDDLADAITSGRMKPAAVYVVGMSDANAFASALLDGTIEVDVDAEAHSLMKFEYTEAIGTEDIGTPLDALVNLGKARVAEINAAGSTRDRPADDLYSAITGRRSITRR